MHLYSVSKNVDVTNELKLAPHNIKKLLYDDKQRPLVLKYLQVRADNAKQLFITQPPLYADLDEIYSMAVCNDRCIEILKNFIGPIPNRSQFRALDCAGGDGRFSVNYLMKNYKKVDLFDQCPIAIRKAKDTLRGQPTLGSITLDTM